MTECTNRVGMYFGPRDVRVVAQPMPRVGARDILVKVAACGICGSDLHAYREAGFYPPHSVMGHEFSGTVAVVGSDVVGISTGERVTIIPAGLSLGSGPTGAFADYVLMEGAVAGLNVFKLPSSISDEAGALIEPFAVALRGVNNIQKRRGDKVAIIGLALSGWPRLAP